MQSFFFLGQHFHSLQKFCCSFATAVVIVQNVGVSRGTRTAFGNGHFLSARKGPAFATATPEKIENSLLIISCGTLGQK